MNRLLILALFLISSAPLHAQGPQPNAAKLKADARNLVGVIGGDKAKTQAYCQILDLIAQLNREKDSKKAKALSQKIDQLQKQLDPEFFVLVNGLNRVDLNSPDGREILSIINTLNQSCD
jgi:hypothetical protein